MWLPVPSNRLTPVGRKEWKVLPKFRCTRMVKGVTVNVSIIVGDKKSHESWEVKLSRLPEFHLDHRYENGAAAIQSLSVAHPDVVLLNCDLPDMTGIECLRQLMEQNAQHRVILVASQPGPDDLMLLEALRCGAAGFLTGPVQQHHMEAVLRLVFAGGLALNGSAALKLGRLLKRRSDEGGCQDLLSHRQETILNWVLAGASDKEIAVHAGISVGTVHSHLTTIFKRLGVTSRWDAVRKYFGGEYFLTSSLRRHHSVMRSTS
jgi:DNA-binding NarL/FixJ family response regulator